jgi:cytochrome c-type biogenesis protein CcmE
MATKRPAVEPRGLSGLWHRLTRTQAEAEAAELQEHLTETAAADVTRIDSCVPGETVSISGMVRSMTIRPRSTVPALEIDLYDGSGSVQVVWMGRRRIPGIDPGRKITVRGRLTCNTAQPTIFNPRVVG